MAVLQWKEFLFLFLEGLQGARDPSRTTPHFLFRRKLLTLGNYYFVLIGCSVRMQASSCSMAFKPQGMAAWAGQGGA